MSAARRPKVLLYGKDARTDAIAEALLRSSESPELTVCAPLRIPGLVQKADRLVLASMTDLEAMVTAAKELEPDLAVIGPEDALACGLVDALTALDIPCFGPERDLARIETSKSFARDLLERHGIPGNPVYKRFDSPEGLRHGIEQLGDVVVKPDGLTGGKGVKVMGEQLAGESEAISYASSLLECDGSVLIEEKLVGEEFSLQTLTDGETAVHCPPVQDHKRAFEGDEGPNTGGMGSYSGPDGRLPWLPRSDVAAAERVNELVIEALRSELGRPYRGVLYGGFMAVAEGVRLVEYNARFGDPEATNVLPILTGDFLAACRAVATGGLQSVALGFEAKATVCKYVVPAEYPEGNGKGEVTIVGPADATNGLRCYWAAADLGSDGVVHLTGSRGLAFVGIADSLDEAERIAEMGASSVSGPVRHRRDIGTAALLRRRVEHMNELRGQVRN